MENKRIKTEDLTEKDIGSWVNYCGYSEKEKGRIKNWNDVNVFVVYKCDNEWYEVKSKRTHKYYTIGMAYHS